MRANRHNLKADAIEILSNCKICRGSNFYTLNGEQVSCLVEMAALRHYRKPAYANGSTGRYFHTLLQRRAAWELQP